MAIVAGVDYGTLSVRVTLLDSERGRWSTVSVEYPLHRRREDHDYTTPHAGHLSALSEALGKAIAESGIDRGDVAALAISAASDLAPGVAS